MSRITRKQLDYMEQRLNAALGRPLETYMNGTAQIGNRPSLWRQWRLQHPRDGQ
jgi:hypothetical protein